MMSVNKKAFTLLEAVVSIAIFLIFAFGIYGGTQLIYKIIYSSRVRIIENGILNEQVEIIRNMAFSDVGIINGSPSGLLSRNVTTTRNDIDFLLTRTIRNIDDPYDGTVGGSPNDTSAADYKLVQIDIQCVNCSQKKPLSAITYVAPKFLEGDPTHGALFIEVFDSEAKPVQGATVHIVSTSTNPTYDFTDTTDNDGMLRIVDLAEGVSAYNITVSKSGYTTDETKIPDDQTPNPTKLPASVIAQDVTEISFSIDEISTLGVFTIDKNCSAVGNATFSIVSTERIGTNPDVYLVDEDDTTNSLGEYSFENLRWDTYSFGSDSYDIIGTIPDVPISILAGSDNELKLVLGANTAHSILATVRSSNGQPIPNAIVHVTSTGYDESKTTGVGSFSQTDWSGGSGQEVWNDETKYWLGSGVDVLTNPGDVTLTGSNGTYLSSGYLESSIINLGTEASYVQLNLEPTSQPIETGSDSLKLQIATSPSSTPESWDYLGPDGTSGTYYTSSNLVINDIHDSDQYFRYKVFLSTASTTYTPRISDISVTYTNSCMPPGQAYFGGLNDEEYNITVTADGYDSYSEVINVDGDSRTIIELSDS